MRYRIVTYPGPDVDKEYFAVQWRPWFWPFWRDTTMPIHNTIEDAQEELRCLQKRKSFRHKTICELKDSEQWICECKKELKQP